MLSFQTAHEIFNVSAWMLFYLAPTIPVYWVILAKVMPQRLLSKYLKQPEFKSAEIVIFWHMPGKMIYAGFMIWVLLKPDFFGRRRKMTDFRTTAPRWYQMMLVGLLVHVIMGVLIFITWAMLYFFSEPKPTI